jgi:hypothetical protein
MMFSLGRDLGENGSKPTRVVFVSEGGVGYKSIGSVPSRVGHHWF